MLTGYLKTAWRNINRHKLFSFINIFGLASGMVVCMLALMQIKGAYDYDTFHPAADLSYRIITGLHRKSGEHFLCASSPLPLSKYVKENYSIIDKSTTVFFSQAEVAANNKKLTAKAAYADADFYTIFGFPIVAGSPATQSQTAVITTETAKRFFGKTNPLGKVISIGTASFLVTGIMGKPPAPSHLHFDLLLPAADIPLLRQTSLPGGWTDEAAAYTYIQVKKGTPAAALNKVLQSSAVQVNKMLPPAAGKTYAFEAQALNDISPCKKVLYNITDEPIVPNLIAFALIGFGILLLAFFNYINLTLARSLDRGREVGIRKVAGALKRHILFQFLAESVVFAVLAFCLAYVLLRLIGTLPTVQRLVSQVKQDSTLWLYFALFTLFTGLLAGWIPARIFSKFQPVRVLKGKFDAKLLGGAGLRKTLMITQFAVSLVAIVTLTVFYRQAAYMANADYGFSRKNILNIQLPEHAYEKAAAAFATVPGVELISGVSGLFGFSEGDTRFIQKEKGIDSVPAAYFAVTPSLLHNMQIQLIAGENLPPPSAGSLQPVLVNEEACRELQLKQADAAIGNIITINDSTTYRVAGVVKDFHYASFLRSIQPLLLINKPEELKVINLRVAASAEQTIIPALRQIWKQLYPQQPFEADWFDKQLHDQHLHKDDLIFTGLLTSMAITIACLGLLGMVIYNTSNRAKEMAVRKIMGAETGRLLIELSKEFAVLLVIATCIGLPVGLLTGNAFLRQYAYRITVGAGTLGSSALLLLLLGAFTIGWQTYRIAVANPVKSLRSE